MFDRYVANVETSVVEVTKEIIKTDISPDKISDIHREYYIQAQKDLISTSKLEINSIKATATVFKTPMFTYEYYFSFIINGKAYHHRVSTPTIYTKKETLDELAKELSDVFVNQTFTQTIENIN